MWQSIKFRENALDPYCGSPEGLWGRGLLKRREESPQNQLWWERRPPDSLEERGLEQRRGGGMETCLPLVPQREGESPDSQ